MIFLLLLSIELNSLRADLAPFSLLTLQGKINQSNNVKIQSTLTPTHKEQWNNLLVYSMLVQLLQHSVVVFVIIIVVHAYVYIYIYLVRTQVK